VGAFRLPVFAGLFLWAAPRLYGNKRDSTPVFAVFLRLLIVFDDSNCVRRFCTGNGDMGVRILIVDDDASIRRLLRRLLEEHCDWEVCGEGVNGEDAVQKTAQLSPDVVILDLAMPQMNGLRAASEIAEQYPSVQMLLLTVQELSPELSKAARLAGFRGAVSKSTGTEVVKGVEVLLQQQTFFQS
jgi:CheY-like chemotaxis protein